MAKNIKQIADGLGAEILGQVSNTGGAFGAAKVAQEAKALSAMAGTESGLLGSMREDADLLDAIVEDAMRKRRLQAWCPSPDDFAALESMAEETRRSLNELLDEALRLLLERRGQQQAIRREEPSRGDV